MRAGKINPYVRDIVFKVDLDVPLCEILVTLKIHPSIVVGGKNTIVSPTFDDVLVGNNNAFVDKKS